MNKEQVAEWIDGIIRDLTVKDVILEDCLRKTLVLAYKLRNDKLKTWVEYELNSYGHDDLVPEYRRVLIEIWGHVAQSSFGGTWRGTKNIQFYGADNPYLNKISAGLPLKDTVASLATVARPESERGWALKMTLSANTYESLEKLYPGWTVEEAWIQVSSYTIIAVLSKIKTSLLQFMLNLNEELGNEINFSSMKNSESIDRIFEHTIGHVFAENVTIGTSYQTKGNQNNIVQGNKNTQNVNSPERLVSEIREFIAETSKALEEAIDIEAVTKEDVFLQFTAVEKQINKEQPNFSLISKSMQIVESLLLDVVASEYTPLILKGIQHILPQLT